MNRVGIILLKWLLGVWVLDWVRVAIRARLMRTICWRVSRGGWFGLRCWLWFRVVVLVLFRWRLRFFFLVPVVRRDSLTRQDVIAKIGYLLFWVITNSVFFLFNLVLNFCVQVRILTPIIIREETQYHSLFHLVFSSSNLCHNIILVSFIIFTAALDPDVCTS